MQITKKKMEMDTLKKKLSNIVKNVLMLSSRVFFLRIDTEIYGKSAIRTLFFTFTYHWM